MSISVAIAVYNGEKYLKEQLKSILSQLSFNDEIVISYANSSDKTFDVIKSFADTDNRIKIVPGPNGGAAQNFENAIKHCRNDHIFLSDQDDIWLHNKVNVVLDEFNKTGADLILHDAIVVNCRLKKLNDSFFKKRGCAPGLLKNIIKNSYIGCCMAFKSNVKENILPFPKNLPMHDQWIGLVVEKYGKVGFLKVPLIKYRRHANNATLDNHAGFVAMLRWRFTIIKGLVDLQKRIK